LLGPNHMFLVHSATRSCFYLPCVSDMTTNQFVLIRYSPFGLLQTTVLLMQCNTYMHSRSLSNVNDQCKVIIILTLCLFALSGTRFLLISWELEVILHLAMLPICCTLYIKFSVLYCFCVLPYLDSTLNRLTFYTVPSLVVD